jgi:hypothetical protein
MTRVSGVPLEAEIVDGDSFLSARPAYQQNGWLGRSMGEFLESWSDAIAAEVGPDRHAHELLAASLSLASELDFPAAVMHPSVAQLLTNRLHA